jgi:hypothetical protein
VFHGRFGVPKQGSNCRETNKQLFFAVLISTRTRNSAGTFALFVKFGPTLAAFDFGEQGC